MEMTYLLSGICDGAGMLIVASEAACNEHGLTPLARLVNYRYIALTII